MKNIVHIHKLDLDENISEYDLFFDFLRQVVLTTFRVENINVPIEISIILTSDKKIQELNWRYLKKNYPTDILCFPYQTGKAYRADIFISVDTAKNQAKNYLHSFKEELGFLVIHGILHLLGWEDNSELLRKRMWKKQENILRVVMKRT